MLKRRLCAVLAGLMLGATLVGVPATASPVGGSVDAKAEPAYMTKPIRELSGKDLKLRIDADNEKRKQGLLGDPPGISTQGFLSTNGTTVQWTGVTVGWSRGTITIDAYLYYPNNTLAGEDHNTCLNSTSCTYPTHWTGCTCIHGTWQLYTYSSGPQGYGSHRKDLVT
ncbi:hypothetical protein AB0H83_02145 [Dactylosporangium sp. NPDC050688]|uniref:hypothetical protein n=1 Tax=Dactylosporangium sp. NPDC050688 TaxID=3157217 RepID=UPI0033EB0A37